MKIPMFWTKYFDGFCSNVSAMECEMQAEALSSIMLMNININIKRGIKCLGSRLLTALYIQHN